jgi:hypothetical protein
LLLQIIYKKKSIYILTVSIPALLLSSLLVDPSPIPSKVLSVAEVLSSGWAKHNTVPVVAVIVPILAFLLQIGI